MSMDLNSLARTLAEQAQQNLDVAEAGGNLELTILEAVIREAIDKTLQRYVDEFAYRFNSRETEFPQVFSDVVGKVAETSKLPYKVLTA